MKVEGEVTINGTLIVSISMASTSGGDDGDGEMVVWCWLNDYFIWTRSCYLFNLIYIRGF